MKVFWSILESACLSVHPRGQNKCTSFCHRAGGGIKSHLVTALVYSIKDIIWLPFWSYLIEFGQVCFVLVWYRVNSLPHNPDF